MCISLMCFSDSQCLALKDILRMSIASLLGLHKERMTAPLYNVSIVAVDGLKVGRSVVAVCCGII